jgi:hypothetical protein
MRRLAPALPLLLAAAACGSAAGTAPLAAPSAPATPAPVTTAPATTAPARPTARPTPPRATTPAAKPPAPKPTQRPATPAPKPQPRPAAAGDVDGDGRADTVRIVEGKDSLRTGRWDLRVTLGGGGTAVTGVVHADPQVRPALLGVVDADGDGDGEVFVNVGNGASTTSYTPYTLVEDGLAEVRTPDGGQLRLVVGGGVMHGDGFACAGRDLYVLSVVSDDGETFRGTRVTYRWRDDVVTEVSRKAFSGKQGDPAVTASYGIDCGGLAP